MPITEIEQFSAAKTDRSRTGNWQNKNVLGFAVIFYIAELFKVLARACVEI